VISNLLEKLSDLTFSLHMAMFIVAISSRVLLLLESKMIVTARACYITAQCEDTKEKCRFQFPHDVRLGRSFMATNEKYM
jgi:hypothetical protein